MNRFFAFGCSFTQNSWPTWADCLGPNFDYYENWGNCGAGNHYIFNSFIECNLRNQITKDDTVIVQWTNCLREDRWVDMTQQFKFKNWPEGNWRDRVGWVNTGNITSQNFYDDDFVYKYVLGSEKGFFIRDMAYMQAVQTILESIGCTWRFISMLPIMQLNQRVEDHFDFPEVTELYKDTLAKILPSFYEVIFNCNWASRRPYHGIQDNHPLPVEAVEYLDKVLPEFPVTAEVRQYCIDNTAQLVARNEPWPFGENRLANMVKTRL